MRLKDVMTPDVEMVQPDATIQEAAEKMRGRDVGPLPVCEHDRLIGIITDRDIAVRAIAEGRNPTTTKVRDVMTQDVVYCFDDDDTEEAARIMSENQLRRLMVLDHKQRVAGIVSLADLALDTEDPNLKADVLTNVSKPGAQRPAPTAPSRRPAPAAADEIEENDVSGLEPGAGLDDDEDDHAAVRMAAGTPYENQPVRPQQARGASTLRIYPIYHAKRLLGTVVKNWQGDRLGALEELMIDVQEARIAYAVLSFGGFLGMGNKLFAIPWSAFMLKPEDKTLILNVDKDKLAHAPGFDKDNWPEMADRRWGADLHDYYGLAPYWEESNPEGAENERRQSGTIIG
jgi:CBS domain-containing protein